MEDTHYEWVPFQLSGESSPDLQQRDNEFLTVDKWLLLLANGQPAGAEMYRAYGRRYVVLEYQGTVPSGVLITQLPPEVSVYRERAYIWIDEQTGLLVKGVLEAMVQTSGGVFSLQRQQVFVGYGHSMQFDPGVPFPELQESGQK